MDVATVRRMVRESEEGVVTRMREAHEAERVVRPYIGALQMAADAVPETAEAIYRMALDHLGVSHKGIHPSALRAVLEAQPKPGSRPRVVASDATADKTFAERWPMAGRLKNS